MYILMSNRRTAICHFWNEIVICLLSTIPATFMLCCQKRCQPPFKPNNLSERRTYVKETSVSVRAPKAGNISLYRTTFLEVMLSPRPRVVGGGSLYQIPCGARGRGERFEIFMSHNPDDRRGRGPMCVIEQ
jgi:hypothetical protein